mmetsp:Transcript_6303/g.13636  ORF Transcript_6303/g.13636 Transcript_6303/m.13636 type:complete len:522 (-) Transcript_6303:192-1757(-)
MHHLLQATTGALQDWQHPTTMQKHNYQPTLPRASGSEATVALGAKITLDDSLPRGADCPQSPRTCTCRKTRAQGKMCRFRNVGESRNTVQRHNTFSEPAGQQNKLQMRQKRGSLCKPRVRSLRKGEPKGRQLQQPPSRSPCRRTRATQRGVRGCGSRAQQEPQATFAPGHWHKIWWRHHCSLALRESPEAHSLRWQGPSQGKPSIYAEGECAGWGHRDTGQARLAGGPARGPTHPAACHGILLEGTTSTEKKESNTRGLAKPTLLAAMASRPKRPPKLLVHIIPSCATAHLRQHAPSGTPTTLTAPRPARARARRSLAGMERCHVSNIHWAQRRVQRARMLHEGFQPIIQECQLLGQRVQRRVIHEFHCLGNDSWLVGTDPTQSLALYFGVANRDDILPSSRCSETGQCITEGSLLPDKRIFSQVPVLSASGNRRRQRCNAQEALCSVRYPITAGAGHYNNLTQLLQRCQKLLDLLGMPFQHGRQLLRQSFLVQNSTLAEDTCRKQSVVPVHEKYCLRWAK